jgi:hypothetical protein
MNVFCCQQQVFMASSLQPVGLGFFFLSVKERKILACHLSVHWSANFKNN